MCAAHVKRQAACVVNTHRCAQRLACSRSAFWQHRSRLSHTPMHPTVWFALAAPRATPITALARCSLPSSRILAFRYRCCRLDGWLGMRRRWRRLPVPPGGQRASSGLWECGTQMQVNIGGVAQRIVVLQRLHAAGRRSTLRAMNNITSRAPNGRVTTYASGHQRSNPSIEGTCNIWLRQLSPAPHVKR